MKKTTLKNKLTELLTEALDSECFDFYYIDEYGTISLDPPTEPGDHENYYCQDQKYYQIKGELIREISQVAISDDSLLEASGSILPGLDSVENLLDIADSLLNTCLAAEEAFNPYLYLIAEEEYKQLQKQFQAITPDQK